MDDAMHSETTVASSVAGFCRQHGISRSHFYNLLKRGDGPVILKAGRRTLVSADAAAKWRRRMEANAQPTAGGGQLP